MGPRYYLMFSILWVLVRANNIHIPYNLTWVVTATWDGSVLNSTSQIKPPKTWFPDIGFDLMKVMEPGAARESPGQGRV